MIFLRSYTHTPAHPHAPQQLFTAAGEPLPYRYSVRCHCGRLSTVEAPTPGLRTYACGGCGLTLSLDRSSPHEGSVVCWLWAAVGADRTDLLSSGFLPAPAPAAAPSRTHRQPQRPLLRLHVVAGSAAPPGPSHVGVDSSRSHTLPAEGQGSATAPEPTRRLGGRETVPACPAPAGRGAHRPAHAVRQHSRSVCAPRHPRTRTPYRSSRRLGPPGPARVLLAARAQRPPRAPAGAFPGGRFAAHVGAGRPPQLTGSCPRDPLEYRQTCKSLPGSTPAAGPIRWDLSNSGSTRDNGGHA